VTRDAKLTNASKPRWRIGAHPINVEFSELPIRCLVFVSSGRSLREVNRLSRPKMSYPRAAVSEHNDVAHPFAIPFALTHLAGIGVFWFGVTYQSIVICLVLTGCACSRLVPDIIATSRISLQDKPCISVHARALGASSAQKSALWWAAKHRHHHLQSDTEQDIHSRHKGFSIAILVGFSSAPSTASPRCAEAS